MIQKEKLLANMLINNLSHKKSSNHMQYFCFIIFLIKHLKNHNHAHNNVSAGVSYECLIKIER